MKEENETIPASPDQMTDHLRVTYVPTYLLAAAVALLFAAFIVRGVLGSVSDKVYYSGVVFPVQGTTDVTLSHNGDKVHQGQVVAMVSIGERSKSQDQL